MNNDNNVVFDLELNGVYKKRLIFYLYDDTHPITCKNFRELAMGIHGFGYKDSIFFRVITDFVAQGGDFEMNNGYGGKSIYGQEFEDESLMFKHTRRGLLTMGNRGPNRNGSIFFITFQPCPKFDDKHVVFGEVAQETIEVLDWIEQNAATFGLPKATILIKDCGIWKDFKDKKFEEEFDWSIKPI